MTSITIPLNNRGRIVTDRLILSRIKEPDAEVVHVVELHTMDTSSEEFLVKILHAVTSDMTIVNMRDRLIDYCKQCKIGAP